MAVTPRDGNRWDAMGYALEGPYKGQQLKKMEGFMGYWFAWAEFYPYSEIYGQ